MVVEQWGQGATVDEDKSPPRVRMVRHVDFGIGSAPCILLIEAPHHLPWDALKGTELTFQVGEDLFVPILTLIVNGHAGELLADR
jgi:hypothetical protein